MKRKSFEDFQCSLAQALERVGDWWTPLILRDIHLGIDKFDALIENLGMSRNLLAKRLKELTEDGLVAKQDPKAKRSSYVLSEAGLDLVPILAALTAWGDKWAPRPEGPPVQFRHKTCGQSFVPTVVCLECNEPAVGNSIKAMPGCGAKHGPGTWLLVQSIS